MSNGPGAESGTSSTIAFGEKLLGLLDTGSFTTSYKYALLLVLVDATIEGTRPDGSPPQHLSARDLGRRVFELYWRQARPYSEHGPLVQYRGPKPDIVAKIAQLRHSVGIAEHESLIRARLRYPVQVKRLEREIVATVVRYPITLLQRFGAGSGAVEDRFIYEVAWDDSISVGRVHADDFDDRLLFVAGAAETIAALVGLIRPVVEREWLRHVARRNPDEVDELRLETFLFGGERTSLSAIRRPLLELQSGRCFYCRGGRGPWEVDHFLPWSRWPDDRLDNLVVAHRRCNNDKRAALPAISHLRRWWTRFSPRRPEYRRLAEVAGSRDWPRQPERTAAGARGLYQHQPEGTLLWAQPGEVEPLERARLGAVFIPIVAAAEGEGAYEAEEDPSREGA